MSPARTKRKAAVAEPPAANDSNDTSSGNNNSSMVAIHGDLNFDSVAVKVEPADQQEESIEQIQSFLNSANPKGK